MSTDTRIRHGCCRTEAIRQLGKRCRAAPYMNNIVEQDHRFIKKRIVASLWFRSSRRAEHDRRI